MHASAFEKRLQGSDVRIYIGRFEEDNWRRLGMEFGHVYGSGNGVSNG
jgi:hypothetical protein